MDWARRNSPLNKLIFPGTFMEATYDPGGFGVQVPADSAHLVWLPFVDASGAEKKVPTAVVLPCSSRSVSIWAPALVIVYFHGNAEDIACSMPLYLRLAQELNAVVFAPEYPGYGLASGQPSTESIDAVGRALAIALCSRLRIPPERIAVMGRSVGTGPATELAAWLNRPPSSAGGQRPACMLLLHSPYTSLRDMACAIAGPVGGLLLQRWNTEETLKCVGCPVLIMHARGDELIPYSQAQRLYNQRHLYGVVDLFAQSEGADHNTFDCELDIVQPIKTFISHHRCTTQVENPFSADRADGTLAILMGWTQPPADAEIRGAASKSKLDNAVGMLGSSLKGSCALSVGAVAGSARVCTAAMSSAARMSTAAVEDRYGNHYFTNPCAQPCRADALCHRCAGAAQSRSPSSRSPA
eukprot:Transcript_28997.p1 GENE.Transcript_28997~~Transcript_28997.p1  ORF type:complete len:412 (-),score=30.37 Transcript_28997:256-1491(-)